MKKAHLTILCIAATMLLSGGYAGAVTSETKPIAAVGPYKAAISKVCTAKADAQRLHGRERKPFRALCFKKRRQGDVTPELVLTIKPQLSLGRSKT